MAVYMCAAKIWPPSYATWGRMSSTIVIEYNLRRPLIVSVVNTGNQTNIFYHIVRNHAEERKKLYNSIMEIWFQKKSIGSPSQNSYWLGPYFSEKLNAHEEIKVKYVIFEFLEATKSLWRKFYPALVHSPQIILFVCIYREWKDDFRVNN